VLVPSIPRLHKLGGQLNVLRENHKNINNLYNTRKSLKEYSVDLDETIKAVADLLRECFGTTIAQVRMAKTYSDLAHREVMLKPKPPKHKPMPMPMPKPKPKTKTKPMPKPPPVSLSLSLSLSVTTTTYECRVHGGHSVEGFSWSFHAFLNLISSSTTSRTIPIGLASRTLVNSFI
jgi:hypothetical protein